MTKEQKELVIKHLEMIQAIVVRMASNSFVLKGWSITIVSALLALDATATKVNFVYIAYLPALALWILDAYFLSQERYFRRLYDKVRAQLVSPESAEPIELFSMVAPKFAKPGDHWFPVMWSRTLLIFHGMIVLFITIVVIYLGF